MRYRSNNLTEETKQEVREHFADGLKIGNIARYLGLGRESVRVIVCPDIREARGIKARSYYQKAKQV